MREEDITVVTRNDDHAELKLVIDLLTAIGLIYYMTHPDMFDGVSDKLKAHWKKFVHQVSIWAARQDIRSLPETEE